MLPIPTSGETIPPKAKPTAPNSADAVPEFSRPLSMASVVDEVKVRPSMKMTASSNSSYTQKLHSSHRANSSNAENINIPRLPMNVPLSVLWNLTDDAAAMPMASELTPNTMLNIIGEKP